MPKPDYRYSASLIIGCPGGGVGETAESPIDELRSRSAAQLSHVTADCAYWKEQFEAHMAQDNPIYDLGNASGSEVLDAIRDAMSYLNDQRLKPDANGGQLDLIFCGHGAENGDLQLQDRNMNIDEILEAVTRVITPSSNSLKLSLVLDCCYAGYGLARCATHPEYSNKYLLIDGFAASLHDELAYELSSLRHGVLTYTMKNKGNKNINMAELAAAVNNGDDRFLRSALQSSVPNPVSYLTRGKQHSAEIINGHEITVHGLGTISLRSDDVQTIEVLRAFDTLRSRMDMDQRIEI